MVQVRVREGLLEGELVQNEYGGSYCSFKGIPYAQPPLGDLRFKSPQPLTPWEGVRDAKEFGSESYQNDILLKTGIHGSEDCLYLNVYTPDLKPKTPLPVMFWIHGGGLICGSGSDELLGPEFLVRKDVILVTINYRLEVLGFLCLDTEDAPGNAGMKDQVAALKWVNKNISSFGGDPNNITIFGESAGGCSVSYHLVSPMTKGLFKRAICQSGVATCSWTRVFEPRRRAIALARKLGFNSENGAELYEFFKSQPKESLVGIKVPLSYSEQHRVGFEAMFGVVSEKRFGDNEVFFSGNISDYLKNGIHEGVEVITGYTEDEGYLFYLFNEGEKMQTQAKELDIYFTPKHITLNTPLLKQIEAGKTIKDFYMGDESLDYNERLVRFHRFDMFTYGALKWAKNCAKHNKIYVYKFTCKSTRNHTSRLIGLDSAMKGRVICCHMDDVFYLFNAEAAEEKVDMKSEAFEMINNLTTLWTNFAKYSDPTPNDDLGVKWNPYTLEQEQYLEIGSELKLDTAPEREEYKFWEDIFRKYTPEYVDEEF